MANTRSKGTVTKWFDNKGFGFIAPEKGNQSIFVHISAFDRNLPRRPKTGDTIFFYTQKDEKGKLKAADAIIEGVAPVTSFSTPRQQKPYKRRSKSSWRFAMLCSVLLIAGGSTLYKRITAANGQIFQSSQLSGFVSSFTSKGQTSKYTCQGKTHCSQMTSCSEAKFYIRNCPGTKMDGDGDGIPCERQWCN